MPVTKTAKRALRGSIKKTLVNKSLMSKLEIAIRVAQKNKKEADINNAYSLTDRAKKKKFIHKNKAARIKSMLSKLISTKGSTAEKSKKIKKSPKK